MKKKYLILGILFLLFSIGLAVFCALIAKSGGNPLSVDVWARDLAYQTRGEKGGFIFWINRIFTETGDIPGLVLCAILLLVFTRLDRRWLWFGIAVLLNVALNAVFKGIYQRERPFQEMWWMYESSKSFPSGHSTSAGAAYGFLFYVFFYLKDHKRIRIAGLIACPLMIILIPMTRIVLGMHYFSDCVAGVCLGAAIACVCAVACELFADYHILPEGIIRFKKRK